MILTFLVKQKTEYDLFHNPFRFVFGGWGILRHNFGLNGMLRQNTKEYRKSLFCRGKFLFQTIYVLPQKGY